eukprot:CAMPEP_0170179512 /NCGR_PEP_ID=MMETSP0040_2-20121228/18117_1 /TAXON_ID=641309 /ORGANISM="Lotharella oceanica, Strain CCMP622" /LENGTH=311 /DNA_ID=CAMNT_0010423657 /DNA_START=113 /DNA_END=1048 /DNA_ORIENTATION=+
MWVPIIVGVVALMVATSLFVGGIIWWRKRRASVKARVSDGNHKRSVSEFSNPSQLELRSQGFGPPSVASKQDPIIVVGSIHTDRKGEASKFEEHIGPSSIAAAAAAAAPDNEEKKNTREKKSKTEAEEEADRKYVTALGTREMTRTKPGVVSRVHTAHSFAHPELAEVVNSVEPKTAASARGGHQPPATVDSKTIINPGGGGEGAVAAAVAAAAAAASAAAAGGGGGKGGDGAKGSYAGSSVAVDSEVTTHVSVVLMEDARMDVGHADGNPGAEMENKAALEAKKEDGEGGIDRDDGDAFHMDNVGGFGKI